jgi:hypothetical protein
MKLFQKISKADWYKCGMCDLRFEAYDELASHVNRKHTESRKQNVNITVM